MMKTRFGILLITLALLSGVGIAAAAEAAASGTQAVPADTIAPYNGPIGPDNSLYGLKIALENLDESFTFNQSEKVLKQINHTGIRLAELKRELSENKSGAADIALEQYWQKMNQTEETLAPFPQGDNTTLPTGLIRAQERIAVHQQVLEGLLQSHPGNQGLARAYNNSIALEQKVAAKIETRLQNHLRAGNATGFTPGMNQSMNRNGEGANGFARNATGFAPGLNQSMNRNGNGPDGQAVNQTAQGQHQQAGTGAPANNGNSQNQNDNVNTGNNQNQNANVNNGNGKSPDNTVTKNTGNNGAVNGGNANGNVKGNGR
jgi:hypothetical protein